MKIGDKVTWKVEQGRSAGMTREGEVVAKVKANEDAREILENKVKAKRGALRINNTQVTSEYERVIVKIREDEYLCPRADKVTLVG